MPPACTSVRFCSNTPSGESGSRQSSAQSLSNRVVEELYIPREKADFLLKDDAILRDIQNQTATEIKVKSDAQNEPILLVVTATRQENLSEVENKIAAILKRTKVKKTERRSKGKGTDNISRTRQNFAQIHKEPNWRETYTKVENKQFLRRKTMRFELTTQDSQGQNIFIGFANVKRLMEELQTLNPALTVYYQQHKAILLHYPDGTEGSTLEEAARLINKEIDKAYLKNVPDIFVNDIEDIQRGKHQVFHLKTQNKKLWSLLLGRIGIHFNQVAKYVKKIDPSLHLRIIKKRGSPYDGIILWSNGDIDDEIFERAVSVINKNIDWLENLSDLVVKDINDIKSGRHQVFHFETKNERAWSVLQDAYGHNFKGFVQRVKKIDPSLHLKIIYDSPYRGIVLWSDEDIDDEKFEKAVSVVRHEIDAIDVIVSKGEAGNKSVKVMRFEFKNRNPLATSFFVGKDGNHLKDLRRNLRRLSPTLKFSIHLKDLFMVYPDDLDEYTLNRAANCVDKEICRVDKFLDMFVSDIQDIQRSQHRVFHFETDDQEPWAILLAKHGINFDRVTQRIKKVDSFLRVHVIRDGNYSHKGIVLWSTEQTGIDDEKFEEAASIIKEEINLIENIISGGQGNQSWKLVEFEIKSHHLQSLYRLIGDNVSWISPLLENLDKLYPSLKLIATRNTIFLVCPDNVGDDVIKEATSLINHEREKVEKFFDMFISDIEDLESGKHRVFNFESGSIQTWEILLCFSGSNFDKVAQQVKEIDSSLHLKIFTPEDYNYEGVILWSTENIDDEKFEEAASIVNGHIRDIKKSLKT